MVNTNGMTKEMMESLAFSEDEKDALAVARKRPVVFDEDCQELSPAMMKAFKSVVVQRNRRKKA